VPIVTEAVPQHSYEHAACKPSVQGSELKFAAAAAYEQKRQAQRGNADENQDYPHVSCDYSIH